MEYKQQKNQAQQFIQQLPFNSLIDPNSESQAYLHDYYKLIRMKKLLMNTQQKIANRIKLFKKSSEQILRRKEQENKLHEKIEIIKQHPYYNKSKDIKINIKSQKHSRSCSKLLKNINNINQLKNILQQKKIHNVKDIKQSKQRNRIIIQTRSKKDINRKLQSAKLIKKQRQKVKLVKDQYQKERQDQFKKMIEDKYIRQKQQFIGLEKHLQHLQQKQKQALINWKNTTQQ